VVMKPKITRHVTGGDRLPWPRGESGETFVKWSTFNIRKMTLSPALAEISIFIDTSDWL
jgi:hypothetical protein